MREALQGIRLVLRERDLWPFLWKPLVFAAFLYAAILILGFMLVAPAVSQISRSMGAEEWLSRVLSAAGIVLYAVLVFFFSGMLFLAISAIFSAFMWEKLSFEVERKIGIENPPMHRHSWSDLAVDSVARLFTAVVVGFIGIIGGWFCFGIVGILALGWLGLHDYTCAAYLRRGLMFWEQARSVYRLKHWVGFLITCGIVTLVPVLNIVLLPGFVAGGTILFCQSLQSTQSNSDLPGSKSN